MNFMTNHLTPGEFYQLQISVIEKWRALAKVFLSLRNVKIAHKELKKWAHVVSIALSVLFCHVSKS